MNKIRMIALAACMAATLDAAAQEQEIRLFSHRGGRMEHDENTLSAFQASYDAGYRGFETDIRMTRDGALVITHDSSLERTTDGTGPVEEKTEAEIRRLRTKQGNKVLFLDELLEFLEGKEGLYVEFEMKTHPAALYPEERLARYCDELYRMVKAAEPADAQFIFTSSDYRALRYMQMNHPDAELMLITGKPCCDETIDFSKAVGIKRLSCTMDGTSRKAVKKAHKEGLTVILWPGQSVEDFMLGAYLGCDLMCTDVPIRVKNWLAENAPYIKVKY